MKCQEASIKCPLRADSVLWSTEGSRVVCFYHYISAYKQYRDQLHRNGFSQQETDWFNQWPSTQE